MSTLSSTGSLSIGAAWKSSSTLRASAGVSPYWVTVPAEVGDVRVRIVRPPDADGTLPVILYMHGGGWVLGNGDTHDRLVREPAVGTGAAVAFVEYDRSPEAHNPVAVSLVSAEEASLGVAEFRAAPRRRGARRARPGQRAPDA